jgi:transcriptional regulator GlxA family with amidase domain
MSDARVIAFLVYPGMTPLDLIGPLQVLKMLEGTGDFRVVTVGERVEPMITDTGLSVVPERAFADEPRPFALIVPGGVAGTMRAMVNDALVGYVRAAGESAEVIGSVCTGALILGAAGLLEGKEATTHWSFLQQLARLGAKPVERRWVEDGKVITSAGVSAGIDMALALAARLAGEAAARTFQLIIEYDPAPPFGGMDRSRIDPELLARLFAAAGAGDVPGIFAAKPELFARLFG